MRNFGNYVSCILLVVLLAILKLKASYRGYNIFFDILLLGIVLLKVAVRKQLKEHLFNQNPTTEKEISSSSDQYITLGNSIVHTDNSPITDEEIPYLMQLGYEESLRQTGQYNGEVLDASFVVQSLAEKRMQLLFQHTKK